MALQMPRAAARMNKVFANRVLTPAATYVPPWAVVEHVGRRSGKGYETPVVAFRSGTTLAVVPAYGLESDWVRNVVAAGSAIVRQGGRTWFWTDVALAPASAPGVPLAAKVFGRPVGAVLVGACEPGS